MAEAEDPRDGFAVSANGKNEILMSTVASAALAGLIAYMHTTWLPYWLAGIGILYAISLILSLRIHALTWRDGAFHGKPLLGKTIEFRANAIASIANEERSRPPRARIDLKDGRRILIKKPLWLGPVDAADFEAKIRARAEARE